MPQSYLIERLFEMIDTRFTIIYTWFTNE